MYESWENGQWVLSDNDLSFKDSTGHVYSFTGYKLEVRYKGATFVNEEIICNSLSLSFSPNPASGLVSINYSIPESWLVSLTLTNSLGILIERLNNEQMLEPGNYNFNFNTEKLSSGLYFLTIKAGNYTETKKLMIFR